MDAVVGVEKLVGIGIAQIPHEAIQPALLVDSSCGGASQTPGTLTLYSSAFAPLLE